MIDHAPEGFDEKSALLTLGLFPSPVAVSPDGKPVWAPGSLEKALKVPTRSIGKRVRLEEIITPYAVH